MQQRLMNQLVDVGDGKSVVAVTLEWKFIFVKTGPLGPATNLDEKCRHE
jgi:hypothetical protein